MIFSVRQLQEKCNEENESLCLVFIGLTKAFDLASKAGIFAILLNIGCPPNLFNIVKVFYTNAMTITENGGSLSNSFEI